MIYHLSLFLKQYATAFNVVHYVSFRAIASLLSTLFCAFLLGNWFIAKSNIFFKASAREFTPDSHKQKDNIPTMGGIFILLIASINILLWCNYASSYVWIFLLCILGFGAIGFWDDWSKIRHKKGISASHKFIAQWSIAAIIAVLLYYVQANSQITIPFIKSWSPDIGFLFIPWAMFILVAMSNAVNLTDGLDGLAIGSLLPNFSLYALLCYVAGHFALASHLNIPFAATGEIAVVGAILVGASLGFLWYNAYPAQLFMGDVGSLALGAGLALMGLMAKQELLLPISGGLFVVETVSVILQVWSFRVFKKRIFKMAPIHHHFELLGWPESKITVRFGIISLVLCLLALITIKVR